MRRLNIGGEFIPFARPEKNKFIQFFEENSSIVSYKRITETPSDGSKFKLGLDEFKFEFNLILREYIVSVEVYLQLSIGEKSVERIETFTGVDFLFDVQLYEKELVSLLENATGGIYKGNIKIDGQSKIKGGL